jgi:hypothetical protein
MRSAAAPGALTEAATSSLFRLFGNLSSDLSKRVG